MDPLNGAGKDDDSQQTPSKVEPSADKQKLKKQKKKKEADKAVGLDTSGDATGVPVQQTNGEDQVKKSKKKRKQEDVDAVDAAPPPAEQAVDPPKKKKKKKKKQTENGDAPAAAAVASGKPSSGPTGRASIGAADLASSSPQILKHCYNEHPDVTAMTDAAVRTYLEEREIAVEGCSVRPVPLFSQIGLPDDLMHALKTFKQPSPIQAQCWPIAMSGLDLIGIAATGSGAPQVSPSAPHRGNPHPFHPPFTTLLLRPLIASCERLFPSRFPPQCTARSRATSYSRTSVTGHRRRCALHACRQDARVRPAGAAPHPGAARARRRVWPRAVCARQGADARARAADLRRV